MSNPKSSAQTNTSPLFIQRQRPATAEELTNIPWFEAVSNDERVMEAIRVTEIQKGELICRVGKPVSHWFGVVEGLIKMSLDDAAGDTTSIIGIPAGGWFGEGTVLKRETYRYNIVALRDSRIAGISAAFFHKLLDESIVFNRFVMGQLNERVSQFIVGRVSDRLRNPEARVAHTLASLMNPRLYPSLGGHLKITQQELANLAGLSRQRVNVALQDLAAQGKLELTYGGVRVQDVGSLTA